MASMDTPQLNEAFELLSHPYRRLTLSYLTTETESVHVDTLVAEIAAWEGATVGTSRQREPATIERALHHVHLPKLVEAGIVASTANGNNVHLVQPEGVDRFLDDVSRIDGYGLVADD